ncbi:MAG TPA: hypothetical protein VG820_10805 [Fimbriimonadaceae bacterium]|nr:hypothetical protein [Fimbriimonadaceae bacterium]
MTQKKIPKPAWYKNTYFWIAGILFILAIVGMAGGDATIRDPGQKRESGLWLLYLVASGIMLLNGWISHSQTVQHYQETVGDIGQPKATPAGLTQPDDAGPFGSSASKPDPQPVEKSEGTKES